MKHIHLAIIVLLCIIPHTITMDIVPHAAQPLYSVDEKLEIIVSEVRQLLREKELENVRKIQLQKEEAKKNELQKRKEKAERKRTIIKIKIAEEEKKRLQNEQHAFQRNKKEQAQRANLEQTKVRMIEITRRESEQQYERKEQQKRIAPKTTALTLQQKIAIKRKLIRNMSVQTEAQLKDILHNRCLDRNSTHLQRAIGNNIFAIYDKDMNHLSIITADKNGDCYCDGCGEEIVD